jgi:phosphohistidine phosphatase
VRARCARDGLVKRLFFLRHAKSDWQDDAVDDEERPLAERGHRAAPIMARYLQTLGLRPDLVLCSTAVRARTTLDYIVPALDGVPIIYDRRIYTFSGRDLMLQLRQLLPTTDSVLVIGHNPALQQAALVLAERRDLSETAPLQSVRERFPTASFAAFDCDVEEWSDLAPGTCTLTNFASPSDLDT